jgi:hypothetical protein
VQIRPVFPDGITVQFVSEKIAPTLQNSDPTATRFSVGVSLSGTAARHSPMLEEWYLVNIAPRNFQGASKCCVVPSGSRTVLGLLGNTQVIADALQPYASDKIAVIAGHELRALEEIIPPEVMRLDKVKFTSEVTAPHHITDVITLLHVNRASLRREQRAFWHIIILTVLCALTVLGFLYYPLRSRVCRIISTCKSRSDSTTQNTNE